MIYYSLNGLLVYYGFLLLCVSLGYLYVTIAICSFRGHIGVWIKGKGWFIDQNPFHLTPSHRPRTPSSQANDVFLKNGYAASKIVLRQNGEQNVTYASLAMAET